MLDTKLKVFRDMEPYSLRDIVGKIIPGAPGWVGCCYRLSPDYPMVDWYYGFQKNAVVRPFAESPVYDGISTVQERKADKANGKTKAAAKPGECILLKENERSLREIGPIGCSTLVLSKPHWKVDREVVEKDGIKLVRDGYEAGQCLGLNWIAMDAATSYALKLPCYTAVQALLGGRGQPRLVDSPVEPVTCAPDACLRYAFETYAASFGGNSSTSMDKRLTIGHLFEHLASSTPGLFALSSEGIGRIIELEFKQGYADEFKRRLTISANGVRPQKPKSAYQLFCAAVRAEMLAGASGDGASAIAGSGAAVESPDGNEEDDEEDVPAPTTRLDRQVQQKWREFKEQQADGGGGKYEIEAAAERRLMRPQTELWLKTYHQQSPLPPPWLPVAASSQSQAPKIRAKAPAAVLPRDATGPAPVPLRVDPIPYMDVEEPQIPDEAPMPDSRRKRKPKSYFGD